jgi:hypothetical protein
VTLHDFFGPRLVPVQPSSPEGMENAADGVPAVGVRVIFSAEVALPPELVKVNVTGSTAGGRGLPGQRHLHISGAAYGKSGNIPPLLGEFGIGITQVSIIDGTYI